MLPQIICLCQGNIIRITAVVTIVLVTPTFKVRITAMIRNQSNQVPHLTKDKNWKVTKSQ